MQIDITAPAEAVDAETGDRSALVCGTCGMGMHITATSGIAHHTDTSSPQGMNLRADLDHLPVADERAAWSPLRENAAPTPCRPPLMHFTMTDVRAGTYFCLEFSASMIEGSAGRRLPQDRGAHYAYLSDEALNRPDVCPDCKHAADCREMDNGRDCERCTALGYDLARD